MLDVHRKAVGEDMEVFLLKPPFSFFGFVEDRFGHFGTGNLEIMVSSQEDFEKAHGLLQKSYEAS